MNIKSLIFFGLFIMFFFSCDNAATSLGSSSDSESGTTEKIDPCANIVCEHGSCINGRCDCEEGYTGPSCSKEITPQKIVITNIQLVSFPLTKDNGAGWDMGSGPDVMFKIEKESDKSIIYQSKWPYKDAVKGDEIYFGADRTIELNDANGQINFKLSDADEGIFLDRPDDQISWLGFKPYIK